MDVELLGSLVMLEHRCKPGVALETAGRTFNAHRTLRSVISICPRCALYLHSTCGLVEAGRDFRILLLASEKGASGLHGCLICPAELSYLSMRVFRGAEGRMQGPPICAKRLNSEAKKISSKNLHFFIK